MSRIVKENKNHNDEPLEKKLWRAADKLRKNMDAAEYKHIVLGLIFLKYISDAFLELHQKLKEGKGDYEGADPEDKNEYTAEKVFYVPTSSRWGWLQGRAKLPTIGKDVDEAMDAIEIEKLLLASAADDYAGLYEAIWELNATFPSESLGNKYEAASAAIRALHARGWIELYEMSPLQEGKYRYQVIPESEVQAVLENPVSWYPDYGGVRIVFSITASGERAWSSGAPHD